MPSNIYHYFDREKIKDFASEMTYLFFEKLHYNTQDLQEQDWQSIFMNWANAIWQDICSVFGLKITKNPKQMDQPSIASLFATIPSIIIFTANDQAVEQMDYRTLNAMHQYLHNSIMEPLQLSLLKNNPALKEILDANQDKIITTHNSYASHALYNMFGSLPDIPLTMISEYLGSNLRDITCCKIVSLGLEKRFAAIKPEEAVVDAKKSWQYIVASNKKDQLALSENLPHKSWSNKIMIDDGSDRKKSR